MIKHRYSRKWKEFYITSFDDIDWLVSAWYSSRDAFGPGKVFEANKGVGFIRTNLSEKDCRALFRHAGVRWYDYIIGIDPATEEIA